MFFLQTKVMYVTEIFQKWENLFITCGISWLQKWRELFLFTLQPNPIFYHFSSYLHLRAYGTVLHQEKVFQQFWRMTWQGEKRTNKAFTLSWNTQLRLSHAWAFRLYPSVMKHHGFVCKKSLTFFIFFLRMEKTSSAVLWCCNSKNLILNLLKFILIQKVTCTNLQMNTS